MDNDLITACATVVHKGDPDRFLATMAAPVTMRGALFALYAFNLEVARAPWVAREPMLAQMRLQYWRDVVEGRLSPDHDIARALRHAIIERTLDTSLLLSVIDGREVEIAASQPFDDADALWGYLEDGAGALMMLAVQACGGGMAPAARDIGTAQGLANYLVAIPALEAAGKHPLPDGRPEAVRALAQQGLARLSSGLGAARSLPRAPLLAAWQTRALLTRAVRAPQRVAAGALGLSEFRRRGSLLWASFAGPGRN